MTITHQPGLTPLGLAVVFVTRAQGMSIEFLQIRVQIPVSIGTESIGKSVNLQVDPGEWFEPTDRLPRGPPDVKPSDDRVRL